jgi:hypothetical protein
MMTADTLKRAFSTYFAEMDACKAAGCYLALLHLVVVLPNVCAALESPNGEAHGNDYMRWCGNYLRGAHLSPVERWEMRSALLHQGTALTDPRTHGRYASYSFMPPSGDNIHQIISTDGENNLTLEANKLADEMKTAIYSWFDFLLQPANTMQLQNVRRNLPSLIRKQPKSIPGRDSLPPTLSSTG